jgi:hypothetical protein
VIFQAFRMNRAHVVIDNRSKLPVGGPFETMLEAEGEADRLNLQEWRDSRPVSSLTEPLVFEDLAELEERLFAILDKPRAEDMVFDKRLAA